MSLGVWAPLTSPEVGDGRLIQVVQGGDEDEAEQPASIDGGEAGDEARQPESVDGGEAGDDGAVVKVVVDDVGGLQTKTAAGSLGSRAGRYVVTYLSVIDLSVL